MKSAKILVLVGVFFFLLSGANSTAQSQQWQEIVSTWQKRKDFNQLMRVVSLCQEYIKNHPEDLTAKIYLARACYWASLRGEKLSGSERIKLLELGMKVAKQVIEKSPRNLEAHYWLLYCAGERSIQKGILRAGYPMYWGFRSTIIVSSQNVDYFYGGIYRYWGRAIYDAPGILGWLCDFTTKDALSLLNMALESEPRYFRNHLYLAECYLKMKQTQKAIKELEWIVNTPPSILPEAEPENAFFQKKAEKLLKKLKR